MLRAMSADYLLREQFATDPIQVYCDYVAPGREVGQKADAASQLIFSVFSSPHLRRWIGDYARRLGGRVPSRHVFAREFAGAVAASRDPLVALALVRGAAVGEGHFELQADFFRAVLAAMSHGGLSASGTEMSPGVTATEMSPGGPATERSLGAASLAGRIAAEVASAARFAAELQQLAAAGTEMSPGGGTEQSPGGGTEMSPGVQRLAQALTAATQRAARFGELLLRAHDGTEMSPGTATEMSPGAARLSERLVAEVGVAARLAASIVAAEGTEMSPGGPTEQSPGIGTEKSPGAEKSLEALTVVLRRAELFSVELLRAAEGTEMSPGTATEMSPGITATEISPGIANLGIAERLAAELTSAARFGAELSRMEAGTEMSPGGGTEQSPGGTEMSPGALRLTEGLARAVLSAQRLSQLLVRAEDGTEMSPGVTATEMSPGAPATEMSPGARLSARLAAEIEIAARFSNALLRARSDGTEMSPGGGTERSPGSGTEMSPGALNWAETLTASLRRAQLVLGELVRSAEGTDMSPGGGTNISPGSGTGTNISPGTGTEITPGAIFGGIWGVQLPAHVATALGPLVRYAVALRQQGVLAASGLEVG
ncbi:hemagglutinin [Ralstonia pseudosolanacearum]|uniref:Hemagglutinin n=2 Tax=Ralstonia solanacearum species complex TaxID=3116862 RepID=A0AA92EH05_RALSL|nr:hemagglutinin [Ralstonia pseudosolanacearum]